MRANELRIGNLLRFQATNETVKVLGINAHESNNGIYNTISFKKDINLYCEQVKLLSPIPLTEAWLVIFGFKDINNKSFKLLKHNHHDIIFRIFDGGAISYCEKNEYVLVKSVHHFQNLYFALTQEEL